MPRTEVAQEFAVADDNGVLHQARLINIHELLSGGRGNEEIVTGSYFELENGDRLDPDLGNRTFFSAMKRTMYSRVQA